MKTLFQALGIVILSSLIIISCKEESLPETEPETSFEVTNPENLARLQPSDSINFSLISNVNGILHFTDMDHYYNTLDQLKVLDDNWIDEYIPSDDDYIIPDEALESFEGLLQFYSLRKFIEQDEEAFLMSGSSDWSNRLEVTHFIHDDYLRTILNPQSEIKIGNSFFKHISDELIVEITDGSTTTLTAVRNYFNNQNDFSTPLSSEMKGGNVILHHNDFTYPILAGPSIEGCPSTNIQLELLWDGVSKSSTDLSIGLSDNVALIFAQYPDLDPNTSNFSLILHQVDGTYLGDLVNPPIHPGFMSSTTINLTSAGAYMVCLQQNFYDSDGNLCAQASSCDTVVTGSCCQSNDYIFSDDFYDDGDRKIEVETEIKNNFFTHKLWSKTKNFSRKSNGKWKQEKADYIFSGFLGGTGGSVYFKKNAGGECIVPIPMNGFNYWDDATDKKRLSYSYRPPKSHSTKKFDVHSGTVISTHNVEDNGEDLSLSLGLTDNCE